MNSGATVDGRRVAAVRRATCVARLGVVGMVAVLVTGCGIRPTPVVRAGDAPGGRDVLQGADNPTEQAGPLPESRPPEAGGPPADPRFSIVLYFLEGDQLRAVARSDGPARRVPESGVDNDLYTVAVQSLLEGPLPQDTAAGLTTAIPRDADPASVKVFQYAPDVQLRINLPAEDLPGVAAMQVSCTVARVSATLSAGASAPPVTVLSPDGTILLPRCPVQLLNARPG